MSQRISNETLGELGADIAKNPALAAIVGAKTVITLILDLADARAEIARMKALSDSQAEALDQMEAGKL